MKFKRGDTVEYLSPDGDRYEAEVRSITEDGRLWIVWHDTPNNNLKLLESDKFKVVTNKFPLCFRCIEKLAQCTCKDK